MDIHRSIAARQGRVNIGAKQALGNRLYEIPKYETSTPLLDPSFPRTRESMSREKSWIPAFAGMTVDHIPI
jgi:hypothetical protein